MYKDDPEYAGKRLNNTLVRLKDGRPFMVLKVIASPTNGEWGVMGDVLPAGGRIWVDLDDLDLTPVPLGFVNTSEGMVFTCRKPMRKDWKQGLSLNSLVTYGHIDASNFNLSILVQTILKEYPTFTKAISLTDTRGSAAFSRDFGVSKKNGDTTLVYRKYAVGDVKGGVPMLYPNKSFLQQHLDEAV